MPQRQSARFNVPRHDYSAFTRGVGQGAALAQRGAEQFAQGIGQGITDYQELQKFNKEAEGRRKGTLGLVESLEPFLPEKLKPQVGKMTEALANASPREVPAIADSMEQSLRNFMEFGAQAAEQKAKDDAAAKQRIIAQFAVDPSSMPAGTPADIRLAAETMATKLAKSKADAVVAGRKANPGPLVEQFLPSGERIVTQDGKRVPGTNLATGQRVSFDDQGRPIIETGIPNRTLGEPTNRTTSDLQKKVRDTGDMLTVGAEGLRKISRENVGAVPTVKSKIKNFAGSLLPGVITQEDLEREDVRATLDMFRVQMLKATKPDSQLNKDERADVLRIINDPKGLFASPDITRKQIDKFMDIQVKAMERNLKKIKPDTTGITKSPLELEKAIDDGVISEELNAYILDKYYGDTEQ